MRQGQIRLGYTYRGVDGSLRRVDRKAREDGDGFRDIYIQWSIPGVMTGGELSLAAFARWAVEEVAE